MEQGLIGKIQQYSTKDGPGIRTTVFMVGCNLQCKWCANPELMGRERKLLYHERLCTHCGRCVKVANSDGLKLIDNQLIINRKKLTNISLIADACLDEAMEIIGQEYSVEALYLELIRDKVFFDASFGGVTFSGGEAALQAEFVSEVAKRLQAAKIHVALDTAGYIETNILLNLVKNIDLVLYDIKAFDCNLHKKLTNVSNDLILKNAVILAKINQAMIIRLIIVPSINDDWEDVKKRIEFIKTLGNCVKQVDILQYHELGLSKYKSLNQEYQLKLIPKSTKVVKLATEYARSLGLIVTIDG